jgi:NTP pyrophosphatase (non-canonical NTP hydrolase)
MEQIKSAQKKIDAFIQDHGGYWQPLSLLARMVEEVGELSRAMNIQFGDKKSKHDADGKELNEELADVLFITLAIANSLNIDLDTELDEKIKKDYDKCKGIYYKKEEPAEKGNDIQKTAGVLR